MNQVTYRQRKIKQSKFISPTYFFWGIVAAIILFLYIPFFVAEYNLRQKQIERGIQPFGALPVLGIDSFEYATLAQNLAEKNVFSLSKVEPYEPETFRTIGYPALVSIYLKRGLPLAAFPLMQIIMSALTAYLIFLIGSKLWKPVVGMIAGALFLLDPVTIVNTLTISTDIFYVLLLVASIYFLVVSKMDRLFAWIFAGGLLGLSTLVRPISMFLLIVIAAFLVLRSYLEKVSLKQIVVPLVLCLITYAFFVLPFAFRNMNATGVLGISTVKSYNIYHYYVPEFLAYKKGISTSEARLLVDEGLGDFDKRSLANASKMEHRAREFIFESPAGYVFFHLVKTIPFFVSSGVETLFTNYNDALGEEAFPIIKENLTSLLLKGDIAKLIEVIKENPEIGSEQLLLAGLWMLALLSLYVARKRKELLVVAFFWVIILYFAVLTGPVAYSRYRLPAAPFLFLLATYAIVIRSYAPPNNHPETR